MKKILIYGARTLGKHIKNLISECNYEFSGFISDIDKDSNILGSYNEIKSSYIPSEYAITLGIGYTDIRNRQIIYDKVINDGYEVISLVHPNAFISKNSSIGQGAVIFPGTIIDYNVTIEPLVLIYSGAVIGHDSFIGKNTIISLNSTVCGFANIVGNSLIGAGSVIVDKVKLPEYSFVKAGKVYSLSSSKDKEVVQKL